jgi:hypothetical protein
MNEQNKNAQDSVVDVHAVQVHPVCREMNVDVRSR